MKHQQVKVDYYTMVKHSVTYLGLAIAGWILFKLIQAVFMFPQFLQRDHDKLMRAFEGKCELENLENIIEEFEDYQVQEDESKKEK